MSELAPAALALASPILVAFAIAVVTGESMWSILADMWRAMVRTTEQGTEAICTALGLKPTHDRRTATQKRIADLECELGIGEPEPPPKRAVNLDADLFAPATVDDRLDRVHANVRACLAQIEQKIEQRSDKGRNVSASGHARLYAPKAVTVSASGWAHVDAPNARIVRASGHAVVRAPLAENVALSGHARIER